MRILKSLSIGRFLLPNSPAPRPRRQNFESCVLKVEKDYYTTAPFINLHLAVMRENPSMIF